MTLPPSFTDDLAELPTHAFGHRSLTFWGVLGFIIIEGVFFAMVFASYFFLMSHEAEWPPEPRIPPDLLAGTLFTILILVSEIPNRWIKKAADKLDVQKARRLIWIPVAIGALLLVLRALEFNSLNMLWTENAYASVIWALLFLHTLHLGTDWVDTIVIGVLLQTKEGLEPRKMVDVEENSFYWRFVWIAWLPCYLLIYWVPRWV
jgi:heme/copper-type cytochrome/quinol oxidase subunit 3